MDIIPLYEDIRDVINTSENGTLDYEMFNRINYRASLRTLNYITGGTDGATPPMAYDTEKAKGFIAFLITPYKQQVSNGLMSKPDDYYAFENMYEMSLKDNGCEPDKDCDDESNGVNEIIYRDIELLDGQQFKIRAATNIELLKPKNKPIAKEVGYDFEFLPKDIANVRLDYIRYPIAGTIKSVYDPVYNDQIADSSTSINSEWGTWARELLIFFAVDSFSNHTREAALKQANILTGQLPGK